MKLRMPATERSVYILELDFLLVDLDLEEQPIVPNAGTRWTLLDDDRNVVNNREDVLLPVETSIEIVLSGEDLALPFSYPERRYILLEGTYDSGFGLGNPFSVELEFQINPLEGQ